MTAALGEGPSRSTGDMVPAASRVLPSAGAQAKTSATAANARRAILTEFCDLLRRGGWAGSGAKWMKVHETNDDLSVASSHVLTRSAFRFDGAAAVHP